YKKPGDINVSPGSITLDGVNAVQSVSASNGTDDKVEVSNSNSAVVTVERKGNTKFNVIAKQSGTATLTFSCGGKSRSISVTVK
ncbi:MAG: hypothetical protein IJU50_04990, partial [Lachnospiraceae bacterium]|nr:hypothetical protein [Lachnospiraceae bacterium]